MRRWALASLATMVAASAGWVACSNNAGVSGGNDAGLNGHDGGAGDGGSQVDAGPFALGVPCVDTLDSIYADPGAFAAASKGAILKCAVDKHVSMADLQAAATNNVSSDGPPATNVGYKGKALTSGAIEYRILYRTERGDTASSPGYSSAKVFIPDTPRAAGKLPLLVGARGSRGQAASCVASKEDPSAAAVNPDYEALALPMVGAGLPIIVPDLAGYANYGAPGNPISGYAAVDDVGKSTLDGARALAKMFPGAFSGKMAIIGHSQGGHSALASLAIQPTYAPELDVAAVAVYSPLWLPQRLWGALLVAGEASSYPLATDPNPNVVSAWYHYTHGELLDGPGHGLDVFSNANDGGIKAAVQHFIDNDCWGTGFDGGDGTAYPDLLAVAQTSDDLYDPAFIASIAKTAAGLGTGTCPAGDTVCATWMARYLADRPHLANTPPILIEYGANDTTIPPPQMACVTDRLGKAGDNVPYTFCLNPDVGHSGVVRLQAGYVADWIASQTMGEAAPAPCTPGAGGALTDDSGAPYPCATPPPNN